jgi:hypothetical protein
MRVLLIHQTVDNSLSRTSLFNHLFYSFSATIKLLSQTALFRYAHQPPPRLLQPGKAVS